MVSSVVAELPRSKCAGGDGITTETTHAWPESPQSLVAGSFTTLDEAWPATRKECRVVFFPKRPGWGSFRGLRPMALIANTRKGFARVLLQRMS